MQIKCYATTIGTIITKTDVNYWYYPVLVVYDNNGRLCFKNICLFSTLSRMTLFNSITTKLFNNNFIIGEIVDLDCEIQELYNNYIVEIEASKNKSKNIQ